MTLKDKRYSSVEITLRDDETDERTAYLVFGVNYEAARPATLIDPPEPSFVDWSTVELRSRPGVRIRDDLIYEDLYDALIIELETR